MEYEDAQIITPAKQSMLAWILFGLALVAGIGIFLVEEQKLSAEAGRVAAAAKAEEKARAELTDVGNAKRALETRVQELQAENGRLTVKVAAKVDPPAMHARAGKKARRKHHKHA